MTQRATVTRPTETWFRYVMGQVPTAVALLTATHPERGTLGMVVGSLVSVSLDPPMVGFFIDDRSTTWPQIAESGRLTITVLSAQGAAVSDAFARKHPDRFTHLHQGAAPTAGPTTEHAVATIEATLATQSAAGDHSFVLCHVQAMAPAAPGDAPLLFLRGSYSVPATPEVSAERHPIAVQLERAATISGRIAELAHTLGRPCLVSMASAGNVSVVSRHQPPEGRSDIDVGASFPLAAPYGPVFVAWGTTADAQLWMRRADELLSMLGEPVPRGSNEMAHHTILDGVRRRGYAITRDGSISTELMHVIAGPASTECVREAAALAGRVAEADADQVDPASAAEIHLPLRADGEVVLALTITGLRDDDLDQVLRYARAAVADCNTVLTP